MLKKAAGILEVSSLVSLFSLITSAATAAVIPNGGSVSGTIAVDGETDTHTFIGTAGQEGLMSISGNVTGGEFYRVFNPDGTPFAHDSNQEYLLLRQTGTYTVVVSSFQSAGTGSYEVHLALAPGANEHGQIPNGGSIVESIDDDGEIDSFTFSGADGQRATISITGDVPGGELVLIYNPHGMLIELVYIARTIRLTGDDTYTAIVRSFQDSGTGNYEISLVVDSLPTVTFMPGALEFGDLALGTNGTATVTVENGGDEELRPDGISIVGRNPGDFTVLADTCTGARLTGAQTCRIEIRFMPGALGLRRASLRLESNAPSSPDFLALRGSSGVLFGDGFEQ